MAVKLFLTTSSIVLCVCGIIVHDTSHLFLFGMKNTTIFHSYICTHKHTYILPPHAHTHKHTYILPPHTRGRTYIYTPASHTHTYTHTHPYMVLGALASDPSLWIHTDPFSSTPNYTNARNFSCSSEICMGARGMGLACFIDAFSSRVQFLMNERFTTRRLKCPELVASVHACCTREEILRIFCIS